MKEERQEMITIVENIHQKNIKREKIKQIDVHKCGLGDIRTFRLNINNKKLMLKYTCG